MILKLIVALVGVAIAGSLAYWFGYRQGTITCYNRLSELYRDNEEELWRRNGYHQAGICLSALTNLNAGEQAQAGAILEHHLDEGVGRLISTWEPPGGDQFSLSEILLLRAARDYRLQHAWANDEADQVERLEKVFKWLGEPDQARRLENIQRRLGR